MKARTAHAFTLIELMAATLIGSLIVTSALGVFTALDRANARFALRYDHTTDMERTYIAVQRAMRGLVVSPAIMESEEPGPPRLALSHESGPIKMRAPGWASSRVLIVGDERDQPQRFELVVSSPPIQTDASRQFAQLGAGAMGFDPSELTLANSIAVRGAFVLRHVGYEGRVPLWELVWQPMIAVRPEEGEPYFVPGPQQLEVVLAEDIVWCRWQVFYMNDRLLTHTATTVLDLPAYVELELELTSGMMANWMFEIAWTEGPELESIPAPMGGDGGVGSETPGETRSGNTTAAPSGTFNRTGDGGVNQ